MDDWQEDAFLSDGGFTPFSMGTVSTTTEVDHNGRSIGHQRSAVLGKVVWLNGKIKTLLIQTCLDPISSLILELQRIRIPTDAEWQRIELRPGMRYYTYPASDQWKQRRQFMIRRAGYRCQICNRQGRLQVHHRTYKRVGEERIDDLTVLCADCHALFHHHRRIAQ